MFVKVCISCVVVAFVYSVLLALRFYCCVVVHFVGYIISTIYIYIYMVLYLVALVFLVLHK